MHIVVPMSGSGERFIKAGYDRPKPLIVVDGAPMIKFVVSMFSPEDKYTFICNSDHLQSTNLADVLKAAAPQAKICSIAPHKFGPVYAVRQCFDEIEDSEEVIVNYCDFYSYWNYQDFLQTCRKQKAAGAVAGYRGFHPHMLHGDNYAFIKNTGPWLEAIQEKKPFTDDRMSEFASNGTYYFARGEYVKRYFDELIERKIMTNGEYYVSMVYNLLVEDKLPVLVYEVEHMLQWGTPRDLEEYQHWSDYFRNVVKAEAAPAAATPADIGLIPMAGAGARFKLAGYSQPKPLIPVSGKPMVVQACDSLPPARRYIFVAQKEHLASSQLEKVLTKQFTNLDIVTLDSLSQGQAITCQIGLEQAVRQEDMGGSLLVGACDNGILFDHAKWNRLIANNEIDVAAFSFRHHPSSKRNPQMYGWLKVESDGDFPVVKGVSVKKAISEKPGEDHAIVGAFYFRQARHFLAAVEILKAQDIRVNGEFYVDSMIGVLVEMGRRCVVFEVDDYICFGTPDDLRTFQYWQSFFHKCHWHDYQIDRDPAANAGEGEFADSIKSSGAAP